MKLTKKKLKEIIRAELMNEGQTYKDSHKNRKLKLLIPIGKTRSHGQTHSSDTQ